MSKIYGVAGGVAYFDRGSGYHHTDIVASLLSELLHKVRRSDKGRKDCPEWQGPR